MPGEWPWSVLDLEGPVPLREVKRAYARKLKTIDRTDPQSFETLRAALKVAKRQATDKPLAASQRQSMGSVIGGENPISPQKLDLEPQGIRTDEPREVLRPTNPQISDVSAQKMNSDQADPHVAQDQYWGRVEAVTQNWPWDHEALDQLLAEDIAQERTFKRTVERHLYEALTLNIPNFAAPYPKKIAGVLEAHFGWAQDAIGAQNRLFGARQLPEMLFCHSQSTPSLDQGPEETFRFERTMCFIITSVAMFKGTGDFPGENQLFQLIMLVGLYWISLWIVRGGVIIIGGALILAGPGTMIIEWVGGIFPDIVLDLWEKKHVRNLAVHMITALIISTYFLLQM